MGNRDYRDMAALRRDVAEFIACHRIRWTRHARFDHPEIGEADKLAIVQWGGADRPNTPAHPAGPSYVCWATHPVHGLCRAVYAVVDTPQGSHLLIITVFKEE
ncbi:MAG: hypothetical protein ACYDBQ_01080 [Thermoplasmatota archaeon]